MKFTLAALALLCAPASALDKALEVPDVQALHREAAAEKFRVLDADGDGFATAAEVAAHLDAVSELSAKDKVRHKKTLKAADADKDGKISRDEYLKWAIAGAHSRAKPRKHKAEGK